MDVPLAAVITEGVAFIAVSIVVAALYYRYFNRRRVAALALAVAFNTWVLGALGLFLGKLIQYLIEKSIITDASYVGIGFSDLGINIGYGFSALSNVFVMVFVALVFSQSPMFRKTKMLIPIIFGSLNGITIGLLIGATFNTWPNPAYTLLPTLYHLVLTFISFFALMLFTIRPLREANLKWEKAGFRFIIISAVFGVITYLSFALDFMTASDGLIPIFLVDGFTPLYYVAYGAAILMCIFAYLGYVMPNFVRNLYKESSPEEK
ncbi:MAG: hypothetical protein ACTSQK_10370 [Candidatus Heimdallarchaeota archaeon]